MPPNQPTYVGQRVVAFRGPTDVLSNLHPWPMTIDVDGKKSFFGSNEHAYIALKCIWLGSPLWASLLHGMDSLSAKIFVRERIQEMRMRGVDGLQDRLDEWRNNMAETILEELCIVKMRKVHKFREILTANVDKCFVELTKDMHWGSGIASVPSNENELLICPGKNKMGEILNRVAVLALHYEITGEYPTPRDLGKMVHEAKRAWDPVSDDPMSPFFEHP